jgi:TPR repeat protein
MYDMSWICKKCETENPESLERCEVCNSLREIRMSYVEEFNETNDNKEIAAWKSRAIRYEKDVVNYDYIVAKYGYSLYGDIILFAPYLLYSADQGDQESQLKLGELLISHWRNDNRAKAFQWFSKSANQGNGNAMEKLAFCFEKGIGTKRDYFEAQKWYLRAIYHGCETAQLGLNRINKNT